MRTNARSGFTLAEVLIALSLALALMALVLPAALLRVGSAGFDETCRQVESAVERSRTEAIRTGEVIRLHSSTDADSGRTRLVTTAIILGAGATGSADTFRFAGGVSDAFDPLLAAGDAAGPIGSGASLSTDTGESTHTTVVLELPAGFGLLTADEMHTLAESLSGDDLAAARGTNTPISTELSLDPLAAALGDDGESGADIAIASLLPDGSVRSYGPVYLRSPSGLFAELHVDETSGVATVEPYSLATAVEPDAPETDDEAEPADDPFADAPLEAGTPASGVGPFGADSAGRGEP